MSSSKRSFFLRLRTFAVLALLCATAAVHAEGIVLVTARNGSISSLSRSEAEQLFLGRRTTLGQVAPMLIDLPSGEARDHFYLYLTGKNRQQVRAYWSRLVFTGRALPPREAGNVEDARRLLLENDHAIAYLPARFADDPDLRVLLSVDN